MSTRNRTDGRTYRSQIDLDGTWEFALDPDDAGLNDEWYRPGTAWDGDTEAVDVPHAWEECEEYRGYTGTAWYRRSVEFRALDADERAFLRFGAVDYEATVWVNGTRVGENRGGYLPFEVEVTDALDEGTNTLVVRALDPEDITEIPHGKQGEPWYTRVSGIWQGVTLETRPETHVTNVRVTPDLDRDAAHVEATIDDETGSADLSGTVRVERDGETVASEPLSAGAGGAGTATVGLDEPEYWSPDSPTLYDVAVELERDGDVVDVARNYFGMRSVTSEDGRIYLNGEPITIRGALDQGYYPDTLYRPFDEGLFEREIRTAKELGFNLLRKHIKPAHPDFLELADRLGILVWEEPANPTVYTDRSKREVREQIAGLIDRDYNRPSVIAWSLYNEEWGIGHHDDEEPLWTDEDKQEYLATLYREAKEWDPTRLICDNSGWAHVATDINDYHEYYVSPDRADAWSDALDHVVSNPEDNYGATETDPEEAPLVISEFGTWGLSDVDAIEEHYGGDPTWFSHEFLDDPLKRPEGYRDRFAESDLPEVFDGFDDLAATWQRREFVSVKDVIERMRTREGVAGYVITEFSDIEWEFNGILDYFREEKSFHEEFAAVNGPLLVRLEPETRAAWAGETVPIDVTVVNDTGEPFEATLELEAFGASTETSVELDGFGVTVVDESFSVAAPEGCETRTGEITATLDAGETTVETSEPLTVVGRDHAEGTTSATVYADDGDLARRLAEFGYEVADDLTDDVDVAVASTLDEDLRQYAADGERVLVVPGPDGHMASTDVFDYHELAETESWNLVASLFYQDSDLLADIADGDCLGWAFEDLYPYEVVTDLSADDEIEVGYVEGWLANWSSPLVTRENGDGTVSACTFRIPELYGDHPVGTHVFNRIVDEIATN